VYGLKVRSSTGSTIIDTQSRLGKVVTSGTIPSSGTLAAGGYQDVSVDGMADNSLWNIAVIPETGGSSISYFGFTYTVVKSSGSFRVTNTSTTANKYKYYVVKSGS
jgi:hypothetical protein